MRQVKLVVVIPVGPNLRYDFLVDTVESIAFYTKSEHAIVAVDDSGTDVGKKLQSDYPFMRIIKTTGQQGIHGGLYFGTSLAFRYALDNFNFSVLLRLDTDALIIGANAEAEAAAFFDGHPDVGLLGSHRVGCDGKARDFTPPRKRLKHELSLWRAIFAPQHLSHLRYFRETARLAVANGYEYGEHCLAAATFYSAACVRALADQQLLGRQEFRRSSLGDDHLFGLLVMAAGFKMADFATGDLPIGVRWRGLPFAPQELLERKKKITHSTRFWQDLNEEQIREFFRAVRATG